MIDGNARFLTKEQLQKHVDALNRRDEESVDFEWEFAILYALNQLGKLRHEPCLGKPRVDVLFQSNDKRSSFIADIATASDRGNEADNPRIGFEGELFRHVEAHKLRRQCFSYSIEGHLTGERGKKRMMLKLPSISTIRGKTFNARLKSFILSVVGEPLRVHVLELQDDVTDIVVRYDPPGKITAENYPTWPSYTVPYSLGRNNVQNVLKRKADRLRDTDYQGSMGIFLCDGGCDTFERDYHGPDDYTVDQVIQSFLKKNSSISFVMTITSQRKRTTVGLGDPELHYRFYASPFPKHSHNTAILECLKGLPAFLPEPVINSRNAHYRQPSTGKYEGFSFYGGIGSMHTKQESNVQISVRALLGLLAGKISQKQFLEDHRLVPTPRDPRGWNIFAQKLSEGILPSEAWIERSEDKDDDWLFLKFKDQDPAIGRFVNPK